MPDEGYLIGPDLLGKIYDSVDGSGTSKGGWGRGIGGKQPTYVIVTSSTPSSGWYPAHVYTFSSGGDITHDGDVEVKGANGEALVEDTIYLALRTGPKSDGTPRFVAMVGGAMPTRTETVLVDVSCSGGSLVKVFKDIPVPDVDV